MKKKGTIGWLRSLLNYGIWLWSGVTQYKRRNVQICELYGMELQ